MHISTTTRAEVVRVSKEIEQYLGQIQTNREALGIALLETGVRTAMAGFARTPSAAEKEAIRAHYPGATNASIKAHCLTPAGTSWLLDLISTITGKYLDHQPETCAVEDACPDDTKVTKFVDVAIRHLRNAYAGAEQMGMSAYDVAATFIINASILAAEHGVRLEQLATIHLEAIERELELREA